MASDMNDSIKAVCERHCIVLSCAPTADDRRHYEAVILDKSAEQPMVGTEGEQCWFTSYDTPHQAIAETLKARWGIATSENTDPKRWKPDTWRADGRDSLGHFRECHGKTELKAVVAMADRFAGEKEVPRT